MNNSEFNVGTIAIAKIGRNELEVTVLEITTDGWLVRSNSTGREFHVIKLEKIEEKTKKLSLLNAAARVLEITNTPLNTKELIAKAIELNLWQPNGAKTPEQSLYSAIFREINTKETPRFRKSETRKGSFEVN